MQPDENPDRQVSTQPFLIAAVGLTAAGAIIILVDLFSNDTIRQTLVNLAMVVMGAGWSVYILTNALRRIELRLRDHLDRSEYARGYVDGISRRAPESDTLRLVHSGS